MIENLSTAVYYLTTDLITQLVVAVLFPALAIGVALKFMRNFDKP